MNFHGSFGYFLLFWYLSIMIEVLKHFKWIIADSLVWGLNLTKCCMIYRERNNLIDDTCQVEGSNPYFKIIITLYRFKIFFCFLMKIFCFLTKIIHKFPITWKINNTKKLNKNSQTWNVSWNRFFLLPALSLWLHRTLLCWWIYTQVRISTKFKF